MRKKLNGEAGLTLVELLAATMILTLLGLMLSAGLQMALQTYQNIIAQAEVELLLSTAVDALADDLRYAKDVVGPDGAVNEQFSYTSDSFRESTKLWLDKGNTGQIMADSVRGSRLRVLASGAYGTDTSYKAYVVEEMTITLHVHEKTPDDPFAALPGVPSDGTKLASFTIELKVATADGKISASTPEGGVSVRCLNPMKKDGP